MFQRSKEVALVDDCVAFVAAQNDARIGAVARLLAVGWTGHMMDTPTFETATGILQSVAEDHGISPEVMQVLLHENEPSLAGDPIFGDVDPPETL